MDSRAERSACGEQMELVCELSVCRLSVEVGTIGVVVGACACRSCGILEVGPFTAEAL